MFWDIITFFLTGSAQVLHILFLVFCLFSPNKKAIPPFTPKKLALTITIITGTLSVLIIQKEKGST